MLELLTCSCRAFLERASRRLVAYPRTRPTPPRLETRDPHLPACRNLWRRARQFFHVSLNAREILRPKGQRHAIKMVKNKTKLEKDRKNIFCSALLRNILYVGQGRFIRDERPLALQNLSTSRSRTVEHAPCPAAKRNYLTCIIAAH